MSASDDPFKEIRPSDLRFDNVYILAEFIARAQRFANSAARIEEASKLLLGEAMTIATGGVKQFEDAGRWLEVHSKNLQQSLTVAVQAAAVDLIAAAADAHAKGAKCILQAGAITEARFEALAIRADEVNQAAERLERSVQQLEATRQHSDKELEHLRTFELELSQFERDSRASVESWAKEYSNAGFLRRLSFVLRPPTPLLPVLMPPRRRMKVDAAVNVAANPVPGSNARATKSAPQPRPRGS